MKYLIVSLENFFIYTIADSVIIANALVSGNGDTMIFPVNSTNSIDYNKMLDRQTFYKTIYFLDKKTLQIYETPYTNVSVEWRKQQQILSIRQDLFYTWETFTNSALSRVTRHSWDQFDQMVTIELDKCDPKNNQFTMMIEEYARVMETPVDQMYKELKLKIESDNVRKFRIQAMAERWKNIINDITDISEIAKIKKTMIREFWRNSLI
jgi:hypothetical protein